MKQREKIRRDKQEKPVEEGHLRRKTPKSLREQAKAPDEGVTDLHVKQSFDAHAALLTGADTDAQRSDIAMSLQRTYGNRYVQRLIESTNVQAKLTVSSPGDVQAVFTPLGRS